MPLFSFPPVFPCPRSGSPLFPHAVTNPLVAVLHTPGGQRVYERPQHPSSLLSISSNLKASLGRLGGMSIAADPCLPHAALSIDGLPPPDAAHAFLVSRSALLTRLRTAFHSALGRGEMNGYIRGRGG
ncbi:hypothetical protein B0H10DRAFT_2126012 [Mycena sp. CBHHK59/15]|nr:hypothetical protein B0H10DRAFT_2126012 [Mycena sp. CBHHK59/15]